VLLNPYCDHVGGFPVIVRASRVDSIADSGQRYGGRAFNDGVREAVGAWEAPSGALQSEAKCARQRCWTDPEGEV
jgi:hypothetical protein